MLARLDVTPIEAKQYVREIRIQQRNYVQYHAQVLHNEAAAVLSKNTRRRVAVMREYIYTTCAARIPLWKKLLFKFTCIGDIDTLVEEECQKYVRDNQDFLNKQMTIIP